MKPEIATNKTRVKFVGSEVIAYKYERKYLIEEIPFIKKTTGIEKRMYIAMTMRLCL